MKILTKKVTPIIKVVGDSCNLRCSYCFYRDEDQNALKIMSLDLLDQFLREYVSLFDKKLLFIWHGGEPLLAGLLFFQKVIELQKEYSRGKDVQIKNSIQTNATLINDGWASFFKENNFHIGISMDGDAISQNYFRRTSQNQGSFDSVMEGITILRRHGLYFGLIQVLTKANSSRIKENFSFFVDTLKVKGWGVNPFLEMDGNMPFSQESVSNEDLTRSFRELIDLWLEEDSGKLRIREI